MTSSYSETTDAGSVTGRAEPAGVRDARPPEAVRAVPVAPRAAAARRLVYVAVLMGLLQAAVVAFAVTPLVQLRANRVPIAVTDEVVRTGILRGLDSGGGVVHLEPVANGERARAAVLRRDVRAAVVVENSTVRLLVASAGSPVIAGDLYRTFQQVQATSGVPLAVDDLRPTLATDRQQVALAAFLLVWLVFGIGTGAVAAQRVEDARRRVLAICVTVALAAITTSATMTWTVHVLAGSVLAQAAVLCLLGTSAAAVTAAAARLAPRWGAVASTVLLVAVGYPVSGAFVPQEYLGSLLAQGGRILPPAEGMDALRGAAFFGGARTGFSLACLAAWTVAGLIVVIGRDPRRAQGIAESGRLAPVRPPADGRPTGGRHAQRQAVPPARGGLRHRWSPSRRAALVVAVIVPLVTTVLVWPLSLGGPAPDRLISSMARWASCATGRPISAVGSDVKASLLQLVSGELPSLNARFTVPGGGAIFEGPVSASFRDVSRAWSPEPVARTVEWELTIPYSRLPAAGGAVRGTYRSNGDGSVSIQLSADDESLRRSVISYRVDRGDDDLVAVPVRVSVLGVSAPVGGADGATIANRPLTMSVAGTGLSLRSITVRDDGIHLDVDGLLSWPVSQLSTPAVKQPFRYTHRQGQVGIALTDNVVSTVPTQPTIWARPQLDGDSLVLRPVSVEILGSERDLTDPLARAVVSATAHDAFVRGLPALPAGVGYRSVDVAQGRVRVALRGELVEAFPAGAADAQGNTSTVSADGGLLSLVRTPASASTPSVVMRAVPRVEGRTLRLDPVRVEALGGVVLPVGSASSAGWGGLTALALPALGGALAYRAVEAAPEGLRVHVSGANVRVSDLVGSLCPT